MTNIYLQMHTESTRVVCEFVCVCEFTYGPRFICNPHPSSRYVAIRHKSPSGLHREPTKPVRAASAPPAEAP